MTEQTQLFDEAIAPYSPSARKLLRVLRKLVLGTARDLSEVGEITEALRWGQFSFLTLESGSGSTIRIDGKRKDATAVAMYFHCQTGLVDHFRELYSDSLKFEGMRAIVLDTQALVPEAAIRHCISLALTHHLRKIPAKSRKQKIATPHHHRHRSRSG